MREFELALQAKLFLILTALFLVSDIKTQNIDSKEALPFREITAHPELYSSENMVARMIDGLGFRFYWATEELTENDLSYRPSEEARTSGETIDHILDLSNIIVNSIKNKPNIAPSENTVPKSFQDKRKTVLINLLEARQLLASGKVQDVKIIFERKEGRVEFPVWNLINGPIADAIWHTGQLAAFRRSSGNPLNAKVSFMTGKLR